jgi:bifunctional DNA-binding transcriptional regulator/antitoxin component of YhaV-PrlF toxin-antitoxin module
MATALEMRASVEEQAKDLRRVVVSRIVNKFQVTVPQEVRDLYSLREGDFFEWHFDAQQSRLTVIPKRTEMITPRLREKIAQEQRSRPGAVAEE